METKIGGPGSKGLWATHYSNFSATNSRRLAVCMGLWMNFRCRTGPVLSKLGNDHPTPLFREGMGSRLGSDLPEALVGPGTFRAPRCSSGSGMCLARPFVRPSIVLTLEMARPAALRMGSGERMLRPRPAAFHLLGTKCNVASWFPRKPPGFHLQQRQRLQGTWGVSRTLVTANGSLPARPGCRATFQQGPEPAEAPATEPSLFSARGKSEL